jgi:hypothetical protein
MKQKNKKLYEKAIVLMMATIFILTAFLPATSSQSKPIQGFSSSDSIRVGVEESFGASSLNVFFSSILDVMTIISSNTLVQIFQNFFAGSIEHDTTQHNEATPSEVDDDALVTPLQVDNRLSQERDPSAPLNPADPWWNTSWMCRKEITIDHTKVAANLTNFPVLISLNTDTDLSNNAQSNGNDIVFINNKTGTKLNHEIELYDNTVGKLVCWVNVTSLSSTKNTILYMYYGNPSCSNQQNINKVWDSNFALVYHLKEASGTQYDSTTNNHHGTPQNGLVLGAQGIIDGADLFDGDNDIISVTNPTNIAPPWTAEFWVKRQNNTGKNAATLADAPTVSSLRLEQSTGTWKVGYTKYTVADYVFNYRAPIGTWVHIVYVGSTTDTKLYINGSLKESSANSISCPMTTIGRSALSAKGTIDEIRMSKNNRNQSWLTTEYNNHVAPTSFYSIGSHETGIPPTAPILSNPNPTDNAININLNPTLSINVGDYQNNAMNVYFRTNASGSWQTIESYFDVYNGTYSTTNTSTLNKYAMKYWWGVNATDPLGSGNWTNKSYRLGTKKGPITQPFAQGWLYRKSITINHSQVMGVLSGFPVLINISSDADLASHALQNGYDFVFMDSGGVANQLPHEIEYFNHTTGRLVAWVNTSSLSSVVNTTIYMYYGNGNTLWGNCQNISATWDRNYRGIWHLNETSTSVYDSSWYKNVGTSTSVTHVNGLIDGADNFNHASSYINCPNTASLNPTSELTLEAWVKFSDVSSSAGRQTIVGKWYTNYEIAVMFDKTPPWFAFYKYGTTGGYDVVYYYSSSGDFVAGQWCHLAASMSGSTMKIYFNGVLKNTSSGTVSGTVATTDPLNIGRRTQGSSYQYVGGVIDEVRLSSKARNESWVKTEYNNQRNPGTFYRLGNEQGSDTIPPTITNILCSPESQLISQYVNITCSVNDNIEVNRVKVNITYPDSSSHNMSMGSGGGGGGRYYNTTYIQIGTYSYFIWADDTCGNSNKSSIKQFTVTTTQKPVLLSEVPLDQSVNINLRPTLSIYASDYQSDAMNIYFGTNASGSWRTIGSYLTVYNNTYSCTNTTDINRYVMKYWWSVNATDPSGSNSWTNKTYSFTTRSSPVIHKFTLDHNSHMNYGLSYPMTYIFSIPTDSTNLKAYKYTETWVQIPSRTKSDLYTGIEAARFNYTEDKAYISVSYPAESDILYVKITDDADNLVDSTYIDIATYYDNSKTAVVLTGDDWCRTQDTYFKAACDASQARNIWFTPGINPHGVAKYTEWFGSPDWDLIQSETDEGFIEPASHGRYHLDIPYSLEQWGVQASYDEEIGISKQDILENITMPSLNTRGDQEYLWAWIEPFGSWDATVTQKLGEYHYLSDRSTGSSTSFATWSSTYGVYNRIGVAVSADGMTASAMNTQFDNVYAAGGIHHIFLHPRNHDWTSGPIVQHLSYIANRSDVWYVGFGQLYAYHYMEERNVITHSALSGNIPPTLSSESPTNKSIEIPTGVTSLKIYADDINNDLMNLTFMTNASGSWQTIGTNSSVPNGIYRQNYDFPAYNKTYWWGVKVTDGLTWTNETYTFTTRPENYPPVISNPVPTNGATEILAGDIQLKISVSDRDNDLMNITFRTNATGSWADIDVNVSQPNGTYSQIYTFNDYAYKYYWSVNCSDGKTWTNQTHWFITAEEPITDPFNQGWLYRKQITINHSQVAGNLRGFPIMINITGDSDLGGHAQLDGDDIVFMDDTGVANQLPHEIEYYYSTEGDLVVWVNISTLSSTQDTILYMYYGNSAVESCENIHDVWDSHYMMVHHLNETSGTHYDSTIYGNDGTPIGGLNQSAVGMIDGADNFDGSNDYIDCGNGYNLDIQNKITVSTWVKIDINENRRILSKHGPSGTGNYGWMLVRVNNYIHWCISTTGLDWNEGKTTAGTFPLNTWVYITATYDGSYLRVFVNGIEDPGQNLPMAVSGTIHIAPASTQIGRDGNTGDPSVFDGIIDEARISDVIRNASWIRTEYFNQHTPSSFYSVGDEEEQGGEKEYIITLRDGWNLISVLCYDSIATADITVRNNSIGRTWDQAVDNGTILGFIYNYDRATQLYGLSDSLEPGYGYWVWAYYDCELMFYSSEKGTGHITDLQDNWAIMGMPYNNTIVKTSVNVTNNSIDYTWDDAVSEGIILGFVYGWDSTNQLFELCDSFVPGRGYWMYAYYDCVLKKEIE